jgi:hypothetical protein
MRIISLGFVVAIAVLGQPGAVAQEPIAPAAQGTPAPGPAPVASIAVPSLFQAGTISSTFAEEAVDEEWARPTESRIAAEIEGQAWPGLNRAEVECRRSICALLLVYSGSGAVEAEVKNKLRKALGFAGVRTARVAGVGSIVSEIVFFR